MYHHVDQSWKKMPHFLSLENENLLASRISDYVCAFEIPRLLIVYHGGEPLLFGVESIERLTNKIRYAIPVTTIVDFTLQTNGTLINEDILNRLEEINISVSLSLDGPDKIHNKHRLDHAGRSSFAITEAALQMLINRPKIFTGVIAVIDPTFPPLEVLNYFGAYPIPSLDLLLPDANFNRLPPGRDNNPTIYVNWLIDCFDLWFDKFPQLRIRFFEAILDSVVGLPSKTDALGFGDISLLTIETDGSYHDLDVLKIAYEGATDLGIGSLATKTIEEAVKSSHIQEHRIRLSKEGLSPVCQSCAVVEICGGGSVPHRYSNTGYCNPSVYCEELYSLINHAKKRIEQQMDFEINDTVQSSSNYQCKIDLSKLENTEYSHELLSDMLSSWGDIQKENLRNALLIVQEKVPEYDSLISELLTIETNEFKRLSLLPSVYIWTNVINSSKKGQVITSIDGKVISPDYSYILQLKDFLDEEPSIQRINRDDPWLRIPFGDKIQYENSDVALQATAILSEAYTLINQWDCNLLQEINLIAPEIQFIKDFTAHPDKIVSFSDNSVPGALYVTVKLGDKFIDATDLADSILHEYRHQKLYLIQRIAEIVVVDVPLVRSPWREELRPPSGLYHAIYVFCFLWKFWEYISLTFPEPQKGKAKAEVRTIAKKIKDGMEVIRQASLTATGIELLDVLEMSLIQDEA